MSEVTTTPSNRKGRTKQDKAPTVKGLVALALRPANDADYARIDLALELIPATLYNLPGMSVMNAVEVVKVLVAAITHLEGTDDASVDVDEDGE